MRQQDELGPASRIQPQCATRADARLHEYSTMTVVYHTPMSVFLTGATGFIGGQVLHDLSKSVPAASVRVLVRDADAGAKISSTYPRVHVVVGDLNDRALIKAEAARAQLVLNLASNRHMPSVEAIHAGLGERAAATERAGLKEGAAATTEGATGAFWVQISGASGLAADEMASATFVAGEPSDRVFDDLDAGTDIRALLRAHPTRAVDNYLLRVAATTPAVRGALVLPPIVFGAGAGTGHVRSVQVPALAKTALQRGRAVQVGRGLSRWAAVHVADLSALVVQLACKALANDADAALWGANGLYLAGATETAFGDLSARIAAEALARRYIPTADVEHLSRYDAARLLPGGYAFFGTNARGAGRRAQALLGWTPSDASLDDEVKRVVVDEYAWLHTLEMR